LFGCNNLKLIAVDKKSSVITKYYYGSVVTTSPDATILYGETKYSLVKRTTDRSNNMITEYVIQGDESFETKLSKIGKSNVFNATDTKNTFGGQVVFTGGIEWDWKKWEYSIVMTDKSGKIIGTGFMDNEGIKTEKYFMDIEGNKIVKIVEKLNEIEEREYNKKLLNKK